MIVISLHHRRSGSVWSTRLPDLRKRGSWLLQRVNSLLILLLMPLLYSNRTSRMHGAR